MNTNKNIERSKIAYTWLRTLGAPVPAKITVHHNGDFTATFATYEDMRTALELIGDAHGFTFNWTSARHATQRLTFAMPERQEHSK
jgi:hypothetical protein